MAIGRRIFSNLSSRVGTHLQRILQESLCLRVIGGISRPVVINEIGRIRQILSGIGGTR
jgi:hypothetical protein